MIILREYKSVVFWLVFVSLWIVGFLPCCNEKKNDKTEEKNTSDSSELNNSNYNNDNNNNDNFSNQNTKIIKIQNNNINVYNKNNNFFKKQNNVINSNSSNTGNYFNYNNNIDIINNQSNNNNYQLPPSNTGYYQNMDINRFPNQNPNQNQNQNQNFINYIINPQISLKEPEPISTYLNPTLIGLNNIGATCFMNATLQCLSQTRGLANYFLKESNENKIMNNNITQKDPTILQLTPSFLNLIQNLWDKTRTEPYSPSYFRKIVEEINPLFKEGQPGDAQTFIFFILEQIHKELWKPVNNNQSSNKTQEVNQYDDAATLLSFFNDFQQQCSIISDLFFLVIKTTNECLICKNFYKDKGLNNPIVNNYQKHNFLLIYLNEVKNMKNSNRVNLIDCFHHYQKPTLWTGERQSYCNICKRVFDSEFTTRIFSSPPILVIYLNRGTGNIHDVKLDFPETIDITQFILQKDKPQIIYNLYGVITHIGKSGPDAHFVASCKSPVDGKWYRYNDSIVSSITNVQQEIIDFGTPYILFYERQNL